MSMSMQNPAQILQTIYPESDAKPMAETDTHAELFIDLRVALDNYFRERPDVYVSGNLLIYYVEGNPARRVAPDVFVAFGVPKGQRRIYRLWAEGVMPQVVIELTSRQTWRDDLQKKWQLYAELGVQEYFIFDPEYDYLDTPLIGYRLEDGKYVEIEASDSRLRSDVLGLELVDTGETLRLFNPQTEQFLPTAKEAAAAQQHLSEVEKELARYRERFGELPK
jgi:Uma2 family endonuclease